MLDRLVGGVGVVDRLRANPWQLRGRNGNTGAGAAGENAALSLAGIDCLSHLQRHIGVVVALAEVDYLMAELNQRRGSDVMERRSGVVNSNSKDHRRRA